LKKDNVGINRTINGRQEGILETSRTPTSTIGEGIGTEEEFGSN
jgi:hypothetical protein